MRKWWQALSTRAKRVLILSASAVLVACVVGAWFWIVPSRDRIDPDAKAVQAEQPKQTADLPRETSVGKRQTVSKRKVVEKLPGALSDATLRDPNMLAAPPAIVPPWRGATIATPVVDNNTGEITVETHREPPKKFEWTKEFVGDARYLFVGDHTVEIDLQVRPCRLNSKDGAVTVEPYLLGGVDVRREDSAIGARAGVGIQVRW